MNPKRMKLIFVLLIIVLIAFVALRILKAKRNQLTADDIIARATEGTMWPVEDVLLLAHEGIVVEDIGDYNCQASADSGVTYEEVRKYLIQLYNDGFVPYEEFGSLNPNRLVSVNNAQNLNEVSWMGQKDNYIISVLWARDGSVDEFGVEYGFNLDINLFMDPGNILDDDSSSEETESQAINFGTISSEETDSKDMDSEETALEETDSEETDSEETGAEENLASGEGAVSEEGIVSGDNGVLQESSVSGENAVSEEGEE